MTETRYNITMAVFLYLASILAGLGHFYLTSIYLSYNLVTALIGSLGVSAFVSVVITVFWCMKLFGEEDEEGKPDKNKTKLGIQ